MTAPIKRRPAHLLSKNQLTAWNEVIGALITNCGAVEFISFQWIAALSKDIILKDVALDLRFAQRIDLIKTLIDRTDWTKDKKQTSTAMWNEVATLSKVRNKVAHNPMISRVPESGEIQIGIVPLQKMKGIGPFKLEPVTIDDVCRAGGRFGDLFDSLNEFLRWMADQGEKST